MLRQLSSRRIVGFFLLDWLGTLAMVVLAAWLRAGIGALLAELAALLRTPEIPFYVISDGIEFGELVSLPLLAIISAIWPLYFIVFSVYDGRLNENLKAELVNVFLAICASSFTLAGTLYLTYRDTARTLFVTFFIFDTLLLLSARVASWLARGRWKARWQSHRRNVMVVGAGLVRPPGIYGWRRVLKRVFDTIVAAVGSVSISPLLVFIAIAIKLDSPGPVLYKQQRMGEHGRLFVMLKFRSMKIDSDPELHREYVTRLIQQNVSLDQVTRGEHTLKMEDDPRITRVGRFIRKTSLDELAQLFNVLRGDMSLVGPRPPIPYEVDLYQDWHKRRFDAIPGMTGLWQVKGRNRVSFDEMVRMDLEYIQNQSLWLDIKILLQTPIAVIAGDGAG